VTFWPEVHGRPTGALANELEHFLGCVRTAGTPVITLDDATEALRMALAMEAAAASGTTLDLRTFGMADRDADGPPAERDAVTDPPRARVRTRDDAHGHSG
jgi:hypothetical protein